MKSPATILLVASVASIAAFGAACGDTEKADTAEQKAVKDECKALLVHVASISPQLKDSGKTAEELVKGLPVEDIVQCTAAEPEARACMMAAPTVDAVRKCVPSDAVIACMHRAKKHPDVRAKCWAGDAKAADTLPAEAE